MTGGISPRWTIAPSSDDALEPLVERLRELCLVEFDALGSRGAPPAPQLVEAFAEDLADAVGEAERAVTSLASAVTARNPAGLRLHADRLAEAARIERLAARVLERLLELRARSAGG